MTLARPARPQRGFTLIELLVAMIVFGIMSAMAYRGLSTVLESQAPLEDNNRKWREIALLFGRLEQDFRATQQRPIRGAKEPKLEPLRGNPPAINTEDSQYNDIESAKGNDALLTLTKTGAAGQQSGKLSAPQRIGYRLRKHSVELLLWPTLDQAPDAKPSAISLLSNVQELRFRYLDLQDQWQNHWPVAEHGKTLPGGVQVTLVLDSGETITRVFALTQNLGK